MNYTIALSDELLLDFYNFKHNKKYKNSNIQALFNYYKTPHITNIAQLKRIGITDSTLLAQLVKKNLTHQTLLELCDKSIFKIILDSSKSDYPYVNIYGDTLENNYSATFYRGELRTKAQEHIKSLLKDAKNIFIYDKYFENNWNDTQKFFKDIMPKKPLSIFYKEYHLENKKSQIKKIYSKWTLKKDTLQDKHHQLHDRYLIIDNKIEIILTSGFDYLFDDGKDFTYLVRVKK